MDTRFSLAGALLTFSDTTLVTHWEQEPCGLRFEFRSRFFERSSVSATR